MIMEPRSYEDVVRTHIQALAERVVERVVQDRLIEVMSQEETSRQFVIQRAGELAKSIYAAEREKLIQGLIDQNNQLKEMLRGRNDGFLKIPPCENQFTFKGRPHEFQQQASREIDRLTAELADVRIQLEDAAILRAKLNQTLQKNAMLRNQLNALASNPSRDADFFRREIAGMEGTIARLRKELSERPPAFCSNEDLQKVRLREKVQEVKEKNSRLKDINKKLNLEVQDLQQTLKNFDRKNRELACEYESKLRSLQLNEHDNVKSTWKDAKLKMEELEAGHKRQLRALLDQHENTMETMNRIHKDELERTRRHGESRERQLTERLEVAQKKLREFESGATELKKRHMDLARTPRFTLQQIARLQQEMALNDGRMISLNNEKEYLAQELERAMLQIEGMRQDLQASQGIKLTLGAEVERLKLEVLSLSEYNEVKAEQLRAGAQKQVERLAAENQRLLGEQTVREPRLRDAELQCYSQELALANLRKLVQSLQQELQANCRRGVLLDKQNRELMLRVDESQRRAQSIPFLEQTIRRLQANDLRILNLERERRDLLARRQVIEEDFRALAKQHNQLQQAHQQACCENSNLKKELGKQGLELEAIRQESERVNLDADRRRGMSIAKLQNQFKAVTHDLRLEYQSLQQSFEEYRQKTSCDLQNARQQFQLQAGEYVQNAINMSNLNHSSEVAALKDQHSREVALLRNQAESREQALLCNIQTLRQEHENEKRHIFVSLQNDIALAAKKQEEFLVMCQRATLTMPPPPPPTRLDFPPCPPSPPRRKSPSPGRLSRSPRRALVQPNRGGCSRSPSRNCCDFQQIDGVLTTLRRQILEQKKRYHI